MCMSVKNDLCNKINGFVLMEVDICTSHRKLIYASCCQCDAVLLKELLKFSDTDSHFHVLSLIE